MKIAPRGLTRGARVFGGHVPRREAPRERRLPFFLYFPVLPVVPVFLFPVSCFFPVFCVTRFKDFNGLSCICLYLVLKNFSVPGQGGHKRQLLAWVRVGEGHV